MQDTLHLGTPDLDERLSKSDTLEKIEFEASVTRGVQAVFKTHDDFVIWGPASVEIVDKEGDKISVEALDKALPQLLRRARLSLEHTDQIVGRILERFETEEPVEVEINGHVYERQDFPTAVLDLEDDHPPALFVAGEVYNDTQQSQRARKQIEDGELTSYSISGEALVTRKKVEDGLVYDDIVDLDLSAVTLCQEGMNQGANYSKVEGAVSDKKLAGDDSGEDVEKRREEIPVLQHPTTSGVQPETASVSKSMTEEETEDKSEDEPTEDGPSLDDVLKRLPDEGELATKDDIEQAHSKAAEAFQEALPEGDLATVKYVEQLVEDEIQEKADDEFSEIIENAIEEEVEKRLDEAVANAVADALEESASESDEVDEESETKEEEEDDDDDYEDKEGDGDYEEDGNPDEDADGLDWGAFLEALEDEVPEDVYEVVAEYLDRSASAKSEEETEKSEDTEEDTEDDLQKQVEEVLSGGVQGGTAVPTGEEEDQVEKQYNPDPEDGGETQESSPALANFY